MLKFRMSFKSPQRHAERRTVLFRSEVEAHPKATTKLTAIYNRSFLGFIVCHLLHVGFTSPSAPFQLPCTPRKNSGLAG